MMGAAPVRRDPINHIPVTQSVIGVALPLVFGSARVSSILLWRGDLKATPESIGGKAKGGKNNSTYAYTATFIAALAHGPILGINAVWDQSGQLPTNPATIPFTTLEVPAAPTLSYTPAGILAAATYYVRVAYVNPSDSAGNYLLSAAGAEASIAVAADNVLVVDSPVASAGATEWNVFVSTASGEETLQNTAGPIAIGTNWTMPTSGIAFGQLPHPQHHHVAPRSPDPSGNWKADLGIGGPSNLKLARVPYMVL